MNVKKQLKLWSRWRDGDLDANQSARLVAEPLRPAPVEEALRAWEQIGDRLRRQPVPTPPAEALWADVRRAIRLAGAPEREIPAFWARWAVLAATLLILFGAGLLSVNLLSPPNAIADEPRVKWVEPELPDASAMVYEDQESGSVVIWLVMPGDMPARESTI